MADRKDALMVQAVSAFTRGCGETEVSEGASAWFHERYYVWIDKPKENPQANGQRPLDVWDQHGRDFIRHLREIGRRAAGDSNGGAIETETLKKHALAVERELDCPYCPDRL
jgi:hypothetical protein